MTIVSKLIKSCQIDKKYNSIIIDSIYYDSLIKTYSSCYNTDINTIKIFNSYDFLFIDQDRLSKIESLYKKFIPQIFVLDTMTKFVEEENIHIYNMDLIEIYSLYRERYNCVFIALTNEDYSRANFAHDLVYDINNTRVWNTLI